MSKIISLCNEKGGVGKTTTTVNMAKQLAKDGYKVLVIDLDAQGNAGRALGFIKDNKSTSADLIYNTLSGKEIDLDDYIRVNEDCGVSYIPSSKLLGSIATFMANSSEIDCNYILKTILSNPGFAEFDYILYDCRTLLDILVSNAMNSSDYVLIPVESGIYSFDGLGNILEKVDSIQASTNPKLKVIGILINKQKRTTVGISITDSVKERYGALVFNMVIPDCPAQAENSIIGIGKKDGSLELAFHNATKELEYRIFLDGKGELGNLAKDLDPDENFDINEEKVVSGLIEDDDDIISDEEVNDITETQNDAVTGSDDAIDSENNTEEEHKVELLF